MSAEKDYTHQWDNNPIELDGWVLAHRMLISDQDKIKSALSAFVGQTEEGHSNLTSQQWTAFKNFWNRYQISLHHHHKNEEKIAFPYLCHVSTAFETDKASADHVTLISALDNFSAMVDAIKINDTAGSAHHQPEEEAKSLNALLDAFILLDEELVRYFYQEEDTLLPHLRKSCTVKEIRKHVTKPIIDSMGWEDRGQYFGKLNANSQLKAFMKQEGIPFFVKWVFKSNIHRYSKTYVAPLDEAVDRAMKSKVTFAEDSVAPAIAAGGH